MVAGIPSSNEEFEVVNFQGSSVLSDLVLSGHALTYPRKLRHVNKKPERSFFSHTIPPTEFNKSFIRN